MSQPNTNGRRRFKVAYSELVQTALKDLLQRAKAKGNLREVLAAVKEIDRRLHEEPTTFGEPHNNLLQGKGQRRAACVRPLGVVFAVYEAERTVLVTKPLIPLTESGL